MIMIVEFSVDESRFFSSFLGDVLAWGIPMIFNKINRLIVRLLTREYCLN
jgi:hypothetical protein